MDEIIEIILELVIEGSIELLPNKKIPKWIRYPLAFIILLFALAVISVLLIAGLAILKHSILGGIFVIAMGMLLLIFGIKRVLQIKKTMK